MLFKYTLPHMLSEWAKYKKRGAVERFDEDGGKVLGMTAAVFMVMLIISLAIWVIALYLLIKHAHEMPSWAVVVAIVCLVFFAVGPLITILLALLVRKD